MCCSLVSNSIGGRFCAKSASAPPLQSRGWGQAALAGGEARRGGLIGDVSRTARLLSTIYTPLFSSLFYSKVAFLASDNFNIGQFCKLHQFALVCFSFRLTKCFLNQIKPNVSFSKNEVKTIRELILFLNHMWCNHSI